MYTKAHVFGKGPTFTDIDVPDNELKVCTNQTGAFVKNPDIIVVNDIEPLQNIYEEIDKNCTIYIPVYPHRNLVPGEHYSTYDFLKEFNNIKVFNLCTKPINDPSLLYLKGTSATHTAIQLVCHLYPELKEIHTYGFSNGIGYHPCFLRDNFIKCNNAGKRKSDRLVSKKNGDLCKIVGTPIIIH